MYMLTTVDNPYDPSTQFDDWYAFDTRLGYNTLSLLARIAKTSDEVADAVNDQEIENAIEEIVRYNVTGMYRKIKVSET
jgi:hypothetical protein